MKIYQRKKKNQMQIEINILPISDNIMKKDKKLNSYKTKIIEINN